MKQAKKLSPFRRKERIMGLIFISPLYVSLCVFSIGFVIYSFFMGFTDWNVVQGTKEFVGFQNYIEALTDPLFYKSIKNTLIMTLMSMPTGLFFSLMIALALNRGIKGTTFYRVAVYLPVVTSAVALAILWRYIFDAEYGILNMAISSLTGHAGPNWLGDPAYVKPALSIMGVWGGLGGNMVLFLAGLQNVPKEYYEVMDVEGGNVFQKFRYVTLPMLSPVLFYMLITGTIGALQAMGNSFLMTGVGPEYSALTIMYYLWQKGFANYDMGGASAVSWLMGTVIMIISIVNFKTSSRWVYEE